MKKLFLFLGILLTSLCLVSCGAIDGDTDQPDIGASENMDESDTEAYWFPSDMEVQRVHIETSISDDLSDEMDLLITQIAGYTDGNLYELRLDYDKEFSCREFDGWDRRHLGYFYVEGNNIYRVRVIEKEFTPAFDEAGMPARTDAITEDEDITAWSEEDFKTRGALVCQDSPMEDVLGKEEKGFHETIEIDGNRSMYNDYYNRAETDFYECFTWEKGKGLVRYYSGYGAASLQLELIVTDENSSKE